MLLRPRTHKRRHRFAKGLAFGAAVTLIVLGIPLWGLLHLEHTANPVTSFTEAPPGESYDGVPFNDKLLATIPGLTERVGCLWGKPGSNPYRGTIDQALKAFGIDPDSRSVLTSKIVKQQTSGEVIFDNLDIYSREVNLKFYKSFTMTFGMTACFNTKVNFKPRHFETANLYVHKAASGEVYYVAVPTVCGNVTLLQPIGGPCGGLSKWDILKPDLECHPEGHSIPEPSTLWLGALGLVALFVVKRKSVHS